MMNIVLQEDNTFYGQDSSVYPTPDFIETNVFEEAIKTDKRERNKMASRKLRQKRLDTIETLTLQLSQLTAHSQSLLLQVSMLMQDKIEASNREKFMSDRIDKLERVILESNLRTSF